MREFFKGWRRKAGIESEQPRRHAGVCSFFGSPLFIAGKLPERLAAL